MAGTVFTSDPSKPLELRIGKDGFEATEPITIGNTFRRTVKQCGDSNALGYKENGEWKKLTYKQYYDLSIRAAKSFKKLGLEKYSSVIITGFNSVEWAASNYGAIFAGGISNGIYPSNSSDVCCYIAKDSNARIAVVENDVQLQKFLKVRNDCPNLKTIVQYKGTSSQAYDNVYNWEEFLNIGNDVPTQAIEDIISGHSPNECCALIYTSGTTGEPKGVMLSHDNLTYTAKTLMDTYEGALVAGDDIVSYLPLSHIAGQMADLYAPMFVGACTNFAQPDALKGTLGETLREIQPHFFVGVPRVWEKFMSKIQQMLPPPGTGPPPTKEMMDAISKKVKGGLGFTRVKAIFSCAAPTDVQVFQFFDKFGLSLGDIWGMSEGTGPGTSMTIVRDGFYKLGTVGKKFLGIDLKLDSVNPATGDGEICFRGRSVMMGYINKHDKTRDAIDDEGWMHSGDLGQIDKDGFLTITGRIKEILITSGGENVAPVPIEARIKKHAPFISNVFLVGDKKKYLTCLITVKCEMNINTGQPLDAISPEAIPLIQQLGSKATTISDIINNNDKSIYDGIQSAIDKANEEAISHAQKVQKFLILKEDFSIPGGELGPTLKLKRFFVNSKYHKEIESLYD